MRFTGCDIQIYSVKENFVLWASSEIIESGCPKLTRINSKSEIRNSKQSLMTKTPKNSLAQRTRMLCW